jgi:hypothetical protein
MQLTHPYAYTVLVKQIPAADSNPDDLARTFNFVFPDKVRH